MARSYSTAGAAQYLTERGVRISVSLLQKQRTRGADDTRDRGPCWSRDPEGRCWYDQEALDKYLIEKLSARRPLEPAPMPGNLRRRDEAA